MIRPLAQRLADFGEQAEVPDGALFLPDIFTSTSDFEKEILQTDTISNVAHRSGLGLTALTASASAVGAHRPHQTTTVTRIGPHQHGTGSTRLRSGSQSNARTGHDESGGAFLQQPHQQHQHHHHHNQSRPLVSATPASVTAHVAHLSRPRSIARSRVGAGSTITNTTRGQHNRSQTANTVNASLSAPHGALQSTRTRARSSSGVNATAVALISATSKDRRSDAQQRHADSGQRTDMTTTDDPTIASLKAELSALKSYILKADGSAEAFTSPSNVQRDRADVPASPLNPFDSDASAVNRSDSGGKDATDFDYSYGYGYGYVTSPVASVSNHRTLMSETSGSTAGDHTLTNIDLNSTAVSAMPSSNRQTSASAVATTTGARDAISSDTNQQPMSISPSFEQPLGVVELDDGARVIPASDPASQVMSPEQQREQSQPDNITGEPRHFICASRVLFIVKCGL
jgi:hypothetical protein